jgi:hypothetical protein
MDVDRAPDFPLEAGVEQARRVVQRGSLRERQLDRGLVGLARTDVATVGPHGRPHPLPLLDYIRIGFLDEAAHLGESLAPPIPELPDLSIDQCGSGLSAFQLVAHRFDLSGRRMLLGFMSYSSGYQSASRELRRLAIYGSTNKYRPVARSKASGSRGEYVTQGGGCACPNDNTTMLAMTVTVKAMDTHRWICRIHLLMGSSRAG